MNCKRCGRERTPENTYVYPSGKLQCRPCKREATARYHATPKGHAAERRAQTRYEATFKGWARIRNFYLKRGREAALAKLAELEREEVECLTSSATRTPTK